MEVMASIKGTDTYKALFVEEKGENNFERKVIKRKIKDLPDNDVLIRVMFSSLNYKDALSASGNKGVTRSYPFQPGIDAAGEVVESRSDDFKEGDEVVVTGYDLGMNTDGGFGQYIKVPSDWIVPKPSNMSLRETMMWGTAGFTAAMSFFKLETHDVKPEDGPVLVTGATGGVGGFAVSILNKMGYEVVAATGKTDQADYLKSIGANEVVDRRDLEDTSKKPLLKSQWPGVLDTVGGNILVTAIRSTQLEGVVTTCGNVASPKLNLTVFPFILRGVSLLGVDSANYPMNVRRQVWDSINERWRLDTDHLESMITEVGLEQLNEEIDRILDGLQRGRILVNLWK